MSKTVYESTSSVCKKIIEWSLNVDNRFTVSEQRWIHSVRRSHDTSIPSYVYNYSENASSFHPSLPDATRRCRSVGSCENSYADINCLGALSSLSLRAFLPGAFVAHFHRPRFLNAIALRNTFSPTRRKLIRVQSVHEAIAFIHERRTHRGQVLELCDLPRVSWKSIDHSGFEKVARADIPCGY